MFPLRWKPRIPPYSVAVGAPARVIKQYNPLTEGWEKVSSAPESGIGRTFSCFESLSKREERNDRMSINLHKRAGEIEAWAETHMVDSRGVIYSFVDKQTGLPADGFFF